MNALFVDTAGWACLADRSEQYHAAAAVIYREAHRHRRQLLTTNYILAELVALLTSPKRIPRSGIIAFITAIKADSQIEVVHLDAALNEQAWQLLVDRQDKESSLVDCSSFVLMKQRGLVEALTTDHHFEQAGFIRLLKP